MPTLDDEVTYISGLNTNGTLAHISYGSWDGDNPATYNPSFTPSVKWFANSSANLAGTGGGTVSYYFDAASQWSIPEERAFVAAMSLWSAVANISLVQTFNPAAAQIDVVRGNDGGAYTVGTFNNPPGAGSPGGTVLTQITSATISIDTSVPGFGPITNSFTPYAGYPLETALHEIGHALGLGHGGPYNGNGASPASRQYSPFDTNQYSIMSYVDPADTSAAYYSQYPISSAWGTTAWNGQVYDTVPQTMMPADILAIQRKYGAATAGPLSGGQVFGFHTNISGAIAPFFDFTQNSNPIVTLWDSGTHNTLDISGFSANAIVNLNPGTFSSVNGLTNNIAIAFNTAIDSLFGGTGNDLIFANNDGDYLDGGAGNDLITGGTGNDAIVGGLGNNTLNGGGGTDVLVIDAASSQFRWAYQGSNIVFTNGTINFNSVGDVASISGATETDTISNFENIQFLDMTVPVWFGGIYVNGLSDAAGVAQNLSGGDGNDIYLGGAGNETFNLLGGNDYMLGGAGTNTLNGGAGIDTALFTHTPGSYIVTRNPDGSYTVKTPVETDTLVGVENATFNVDVPQAQSSPVYYLSMLPSISMAQFAAESFNPLTYIASYGDLIKGAGDNQDIGLQHYMLHGYFEGRTATFNPLEYIASYSDLIKGAGDNQTIGLEHYILHGYYEGRIVSFNPLQYIASYGDLVKGAGDNQTIGLEHYILHGFYEGRTATFNALQYTASYADLIKGFGDNQTAALEHYINHGFYEGRTATFNPLQYIASYGDLIKGAGDNQTIGLEHYVLHGYYEGRTATFDPLQYIASYDDLIRGAGDNSTIGLEHYVLHGFYEGRTATFDPVTYILANAGTLNGQYDAQSATLQFIQHGYAQGNTRTGAFGEEQTDHALTLGVAKADSLTVGDKDWFSVNLTAGIWYDVTLTSDNGTTLSDPLLSIANAQGQVGSSQTDIGGHLAKLAFSPNVSGTYYMIAASNIPGGSGNYNMMVAPH